LLRDERVFFIHGSGYFTVFTGTGGVPHLCLIPSDVGYIPQAASHYTENTGDQGISSTLRC
jgi:oxalate decarboxylase/phosphoglucose isomerase-like protein (cupin superfamily)